MNQKSLPNLQVLLSVLFSIAALLAPLFLTRGNLVIGTLIVLGLLLGGVTLAVGYRVTVQKRSVEYPFAGWSAWLLKRFTGERAVQPPERTSRRAARNNTYAQSSSLRLIGALNFVLGGLLVLGMLYAAFSIIL